MSDCSRERIVDMIHTRSLYWEVDSVDPRMIDHISIGRAWDTLLLSLAKPVLKLYPKAKVIVDGSRMIPGINRQLVIPKADDTFPAVSAASVLAKYLQTCSMDDLHNWYPEYRFDRHRGYGTALHKARLEEFGPCPEHRRSFAPVKRAMNKKWSSTSSG